MFESTDPIGYYKIDQLDEGLVFTPIELGVIDLASVTITRSETKTGDSSTYTVEFIPANDIPADGLVGVIFPEQSGAELDEDTVATACTSPCEYDTAARKVSVSHNCGGICTAGATATATF